MNAQEDTKEIEVEDVSHKEMCGKCGGLLVKNGQAFKQIRTLVGALRYQRIRLRCRGCDKESYLLDGGIGLEWRDGMTLGVRKRAPWAAVEVSYEKTHQFLEKFRGLEVSARKSTSDDVIQKCTSKPKK